MGTDCQPEYVIDGPRKLRVRRRHIDPADRFACTCRRCGHTWRTTVQVYLCFRDAECPECGSRYYVARNPAFGWAGERGQCVLPLTRQGGED